MSSLSRRGALLATLALGLAAATPGCGGEGDPGSNSAAEVTVAATTGVAADIVEQVAGAGVEVVELVPDGASPHSYAPSAREQQAIAEADLLVQFHPDLEEALPIDAASEVIVLADHVGVAQAGDEQHEHSSAGSDPHIWLDPTLIAAALPALADALGGVDPERADEYRGRAKDYAAELEELDAELAAMVEAVPLARRKLVTSHDLMGYFADRYGFEVIGAPFGLSPEAEASAGEVAELIDLVQAADVPAVFAQEGDDPEVLRLIADEAGVEVVDDLLVESLGEAGQTYPEMLRYTTRRITEALSG